MSRPCPYQPTVTLKGGAYAVLGDGQLQRLSRHQILTGDYPEGTVEVIVGVHGHLSAHRARHGRDLVRLTCDEATGYARQGHRAVRDVLARTTGLTGTLGGDGDRHLVQADVYHLHGQRLVFGAPPGSQFPGSDDPQESTTHLPRNPYLISGTGPETDAGRDAAMLYTAALATCEAAVCRECARLGNHPCGACSPAVLAARQDAARILGERWIMAARGTGGWSQYGGDGIAVPNTVVDALLWSSSRGDRQAEIELQALAAVGERLIAQQLQLDTGSMLSAVETDAAYALDDEDFARWLDDRRAAQVAAPQETYQQRTRELQQRFDERLREGKPPRKADAAAMSRLLAEPTYTFERAAREIAIMAAVRDEGLGHVGVDQLYLVHETSHDIERDSDGNVVLRPVGDYEAGTYRGTLHFCLNGRVTAVMGRGSVDSGRCIIVPLKAVIDANPGALDKLFVVDTFLTPEPGGSLKLPREATTVLDYNAVDRGVGADDDGAVEPIQAARSAAVAEVLQQAGAPVFTIWGHNSTAGADSRVSQIADQIGVSGQGLHADSPHAVAERALNSFDTIKGRLPQLRITARDLARMSLNARLRMVNHQAWGGAIIEPDRSADDFTIG